MTPPACVPMLHPSCSRRLPGAPRGAAAVRTRAVEGLLVAASLAIAATACGRDAARSAAGATRRDTVGDTIIVHNADVPAAQALAPLTEELSIGRLEGEEVYQFGYVFEVVAGPDGSIYAWDQQVPALRKYDANGVFVKQFGRAGDGPGEYRQITGMVTRPDGRLYTWDPAAGRLTIYSPDGEVLDTWREPGGMFSQKGIQIDTAGHVYLMIQGRAASPGKQFVSSWLHLSATGAVIDTIAEPDFGFQPAALLAQSEHASASAWVPFTPTESWTISPLGFVVAGVSSHYRLDEFLPGGRRLRIEKEATPAPVHSEEAQERRDLVTSSLRHTQPGWNWNGPGVPDTKPFYEDIVTGADGRIWVLLYTEAKHVPPPADTTHNRGMRLTWLEPTVYDVFESDGSYLGRVEPPAGVSLRETRGDQAWGVARDSLDIEYIKRFHIAWPKQ